MNIVQESKNQLEAVLKVVLKEDDYRDKVAAELKNMQRKAQIAGFRPGKVPFGMIKKMYGKSVMVDQVNKILVDEVYKYIKDNNLHILGNPIPNHEAAEKIDWDTQTEFEFSYEIGFAPKVELQLTDQIEVDYYRIEVAHATIESYIDDMRRRFGKRVNPEVTQEEDVIFCEFAELETEGSLKTGGHNNRANLFIKFVTDKNLKEKLTGAKIGHSVDAELLKALENETEAASLLGVKKEDLQGLSPWFRITIENISRIEPAEVNEEFYKKALPEAEIKSKEEFIQKLSEIVSTQYQADVDKHFRNEVIKKLIEVANLELPEIFLKRWVAEASKEETTPEKIEAEFPKLADSFRWQLIEDYLISSNNLEVTTTEITDHLSAFMRAQLKQYGQENVEQAVIDNFVKDIMKNQDEMKKVYDNLLDQKLMNLYKEKLKLNEVQISFDDFVKLVTEKYQAEKALA